MLFKVPQMCYNILTNKHFVLEIYFLILQIQIKVYNKILLVKEQLDGKWALPGGYQDVNVSIRENVIKEASEEAGAVVQPLKVVAVLDYNRHHHVNFPLGMVKIFVLCEYINHSFNENTETLGAEFYSLDDLPELSLTRITKKQLEMCFECYKDPQNWDTIFD